MKHTRRSCRIEQKKPISFSRKEASSQRTMVLATRSDVAEYDTTKQSKMMLEMNTARPGTTWVAVRSGGNRTNVIPYGSDGVTAIVGDVKPSDYAQVDEKILDAYRSVISEAPESKEEEKKESGDPLKQLLTDLKKKRPNATMITLKIRNGANRIVKVPVSTEKVGIDAVNSMSKSNQRSVKFPSSPFKAVYENTKGPDHAYVKISNRWVAIEVDKFDAGSATIEKDEVKKGDVTEEEYHDFLEEYPFEEVFPSSQLKEGAPPYSYINKSQFKNDFDNAVDDAIQMYKSKHYGGLNDLASFFLQTSVSKDDVKKKLAGKPKSIIDYVTMMMVTS
jgi:hypothetical protein